MAKETVVRLPDRLERLAIRLKDYLSLNDANRDDWIKIQQGICFTLVEARDEFRADIDFGLWCETNGFGLNDHTRAAAIAMGREPEALRKCLEATERRSLHTIYQFDFPRFGNVSKPSRRRTQRLPLGAPPNQRKKAEQAYDELNAAGETITAPILAEKAGVHQETARKAILVKRAQAELDPLTPSEMRTTQRKRFDLAVHKARAEIREALKAEVYKELDVFVRDVSDRAKRADEVLASYGGVMSREAFRKIRACLHPDHNTFAHAAEALQIFSELERVLVKPEEPVFSGPPLPTTAAELMAMRRRR